MPTTLHPGLQLEMHGEERVRDVAADIALNGFSGPGRPSENASEAFATLARSGSQLWLDTGDREEIEPLWSREFSGLTTNNSLINKIVQRGELDQFIPEAAQRLREAGVHRYADLILELGFVANARIALSLVETFGSKVSVELHPAMAHDIEASLIFARRYYALCPEKFIIKIPLQPAGFLVVRKLSEEGIPVNYTLGFSARQNYLATYFSRPAYVNVFLGRLNSVVEENELGDPTNIGEKTTLASQEAISQAKAEHPTLPTRQIAASIRNGQQIADLAGVDVLTMPPKAAEEFRNLNLDGDSLRPRLANDLPVTLNEPTRADVETLWTITDEFRQYVDNLCKEETRSWDGDRFAEYAKAQGIRLFHNWTPEEISVLTEDGKIPTLSKWENVPLDDLMTQAALQTFATDQQALDDHLSDLIGI